MIVTGGIEFEDIEWEMGQVIGKISWTRDSDNNLAINPQYNSCNRALIHRMRNSGGGPGQENENFFMIVKSPNQVNVLKIVIIEFSDFPESGKQERILYYEAHTTDFLSSSDDRPQ